MSVSLAPSGALPSYLQSQPWQTSQGFLNQIGGIFGQSQHQLSQAYNGQMATNWDQGRALAAAAANQYVQRARQSGASTLGAGFAQAGAMLPVYQENQSLMSDLASKQMQNRADYAQIGAGLSGDIGRFQGQYQGTLADYFLGQQRLQQAQNQFGQSFGLQQQSLNQQGAFQQGQLRNQTIGLGLQYQKQNPVFGSYSTDLLGNPMGPADASGMRTTQAGQNFNSGLRSAISSFI